MLKGYTDRRGRTSLYRNVYRVRYAQYIARRMLDIDKEITADDEHHARSRCSAGLADIRGGISVEFVEALTPIEEPER